VNKVVLNRKQIEQLAQIANHFKEVELFTVTSESTSGIGPTVRVQCDLFSTQDTNIDITDVESW